MAGRAGLPAHQKLASCFAALIGTASWLSLKRKEASVPGSELGLGANGAKAEQEMSATHAVGAALACLIATNNLLGHRLGVWPLASNYLALASWGLHFISGTSVLLERIPFPKMALDFYSSSYSIPFLLLTLFFSVMDQSYARKILPEAVVLVLAELHALLLWAIYTKFVPEKGYVVPMVNMQLVQLVIPCLCYHLPGRLSSTTRRTPQPATALKAAPAGAAASSHITGKKGCAECSDQEGEQQAEGAAPFKQAGSLQRVKDDSAMLCDDEGEDEGEPKKVPAPAKQAPVSTQQASGAGPQATEQLKAPITSTTTGAGTLSAAVSILRAPVRAYQSPLGPHAQVVLKLVSQDEPEHVPPGGPLALQALVRNASRRADMPMEVMRVSMRRGCILVGMDVLPAVLCGHSGAWDPSMPDADGIMHIAALMLPQLLCTMGLRSMPSSRSNSTLCSEDGFGKGARKGAMRELVVGTSVTLQLGLHAVRAQWAGVEAGWQLELMPTDPASTAGSSNSSSSGRTQPRLGLVLLETCKLSRSAMGSNASKRAWWRARRMPAGNVAGPAPRVWRVRVQLQVWGLAAGQQVVGSIPEPEGQYVPGSSSGAAAVETKLASDGQVPSTYGSAGSLEAEAAAASSEMVASSSSTLQVWAHCEAGHLSVRVLGDDHQPDGSCSEEAAEKGSLQVVQVEIDVPEAALLHHHPGGPILQLQPITLELWRGQSLLDSQPVLLAASEHLLPASATDAIEEPGDKSRGDAATGVPVEGSWCRWWGTKGGQMLEVDAVGELQAQARSLQDAAGSMEEVEGHASLVRDVTYWLGAMQRVAQARGVCLQPQATCMADTLPRLHANLPLTDEAQLATLGAALEGYAVAAGMRALAQLVRAQRGMLLRGPQHSQRLDAVAKQAPVATTTAPAVGEGPDVPSASLTGRILPFSSMMRAVRVALLGYGCGACEALYRARLAGYVLHGRARISLVLGALTAVGLAHMLSADRAAAHSSHVVINPLHALLHLLSWGAAVWPHVSSGARGRNLTEMEHTAGCHLACVPLLASPKPSRAVALSGSSSGSSGVADKQDAGAASCHSSSSSPAVLRLTQACCTCSAVRAKAKQRVYVSHVLGAAAGVLRLLMLGLVCTGRLHLPVILQKQYAAGKWVASVLACNAGEQPAMRVVLPAPMWGFLALLETSLHAHLLHQHASRPAAYSPSAAPTEGQHQGGMQHGVESTSSAPDVAAILAGLTARAKDVLASLVVVVVVPLALDCWVRSTLMGGMAKRLARRSYAAAVL